MAEYVSKHRILRQDMLLAGCDEVRDKRATVAYIVRLPKDKKYWNGFRSRLSMMDDDEYPKTIDKLEIKMRNYVNANPSPRRQAYDDKNWRFPILEGQTGW